MKNTIRNLTLLIFLLASAPTLAWESEVKGIMFMDALDDENMILAENQGDGKYRVIHLKLVGGDLIVKSVQTINSIPGSKLKRGKSKPAYVEVVVEYLANSVSLATVVKLDNTPTGE